MADAKEPKVAPLEEVKLVLGAIDHNVHFENFVVEFKAGIAKVEKAVAKQLKDLGIVE